MEGFFKKTKDTAKILGAAALVSIPNQAGNEKPPEPKPIEISAETQEEKKIKDKINVAYENYTIDEKYETFIPKEKIENVIKTLQKSVAEEIPKKIDKYYNFEYNNGRKISSHDHSILALGGNAKFDIDSYNNMINKRGDSLFYTKNPSSTMSLENYTRLQNGIKDTTKVQDDLLEKSKKEYLDYIERSNYSMTPEFHIGSTAYSLLRSGAYDKWKSEGGEKSKLLDKIIADINNPKYYNLDTANKDTLPVITGNFFTHAYEVEWITATWIELEKRGITPHFNRGNDTLKPFTLEELNTINQEKYNFTKDTTEKNAPDKLNNHERNKNKSENFQMHDAACEGTHALHALVMYDIHTKDTIKLNEHLNESMHILKEILKEAETLTDSSESSEYSEILHDLSHALLPFTELPDDFKLNPELKKVAQEGIMKIIEYYEITKNKSNQLNINDMSHIIDTLSHLPKCVLEK